MPDEKKDPKPMNDPEVHVTVTPKNPRDPDHKRAAEKVKEAVKEGVKKVIKEAAPDGAKKQLDAADGKIDEAKHGAPPNKIEKINVKVKGKDADGDEYHHERTVKPDG